MSRYILISFACLFLNACAGSDNFLRSEPATYFPANISSVELTGDLSEVGSISCLQKQDAANSAGSRNRPVGSSASVSENDLIERCLYVGIDLTKLLKVSPQNTASVVSLLLSISDLNCSTYLHRVLANRSGFEASRNILSSLTQAASAGTVFNNPAISAGLDVTNLVIGGAIDQLDATYFYNETFQALEAIALSEREKISVIIEEKVRMARQSTSRTPYLMTEAISDIRSYDDACSMRVAVSKLADSAEDLLEEQENNSARYRLANDSDKAGIAEAIATGAQL